MQFLFTNKQKKVLFRLESGAIARHYNTHSLSHLEWFTNINILLYKEQVVKYYHDKFYRQTAHKFYSHSNSIVVTF